MGYDELLNSAYEDVEVNVDLKKERFEVPKVKGHHLGGKTIVNNFLSIALFLRRDPVHLMKFLSKELASQTEISNGRLILSRKLSSNEINTRIQKYVSCFVLCSYCKKPDTELVTEDGKEIVRCLACGKTCEVHRI